MKQALIFTILFFSYNLVYSQQGKKKDLNLIKEDYVPDSTTAIKIAEAIWLPIYGEGIYTKKPFLVKLKDGKVWIVEGTLVERKGGVPYIEIQKKDCKILKVSHGK